MTALLLFVLGIAGQGAPPAGVVAGQVVDAAGVPLPDAIVTLAGPRVSPTQPSNVRRLLTDRDGRYVFSDLAPGKYFLEAARDGYAGGGYAQRSAGGESLLLEIANAEPRRDVTLTLWRYAVIAGTVLDEAGEP